MTDAVLWKMNGDKIECQLCAHRCLIPSGKTGICGVRKNSSGKLLATTYGKVSSMGPDPIEKKPLYHFLPGSNVFSLGSVGCNFRCDFCQNWTISQEYTTRGLRDVEPEQIPILANRYRCSSVSWTYNEPTIWFEYTLDGAKMAKTSGLGTSYVTNGYMTEEALREISPYLDAMNIDVKAFTDEFYRKRSKAKLQPVLDTCELAKKLGIHIELTYLIIPDQNDNPAELRKFAAWVSNSLGPDTPVHFSRFHPDYNLHTVRGTPMETLKIAHHTAREEGLRFVYLGNVAHCDEENTYCPKCGTLALERTGLRLVRNLSREGKCGKCGEDLNIVIDTE
ncbi:MAG: AmmeMemoRadiSam system radical SAM enzyme [Candidatus Thermoplasmatota archaeon]|nr:AmmeMemoRadiSam system radical SAM enzyme [Euryarchaeota archaeon]MBU4032831.1 AmmeMemoRadiSam system radical SAM enzyme [Candidatus Thermoplasmatota archaeon]MBU4071556.1 AmmeMemoRadiSam system radical SAM enzyme [Candidatus Thermoplasmatota archaeon]MBU4144484.1 AmmeMemoRadiSam system radical SAM enzyme [Candidatus Thermoplasmatota archaeon]MBU4592722.1 AmmeMemoRadiSam system radical SAM enzyme [Candidatus Thermoplasmatota archaeon]